MNRTILVVAAACLIVGYVASEIRFDPTNPFVPAKPDRPVAKLLARVAKLGLWVAVFAQPQPQTPEQFYADARRNCGENALVCHREGW